MAAASSKSTSERFTGASWIATLVKRSLLLVSGSVKRLRVVVDR